MKGAVILKYNLLVALRRSLNWQYPGNKKPPSKWIAVLLGSSWLRGQDLNFAARPNKIAPYYLYQSITATRLTRKHPEPTPPPLDPNQSRSVNQSQ